MTIRHARFLSIRLPLAGSVAGLAACLALTGCSGMSGPDCINETRSLGVSARLASTLAAQPGDTGTAQLSLHEARNVATKATAEREILWFVGSTLDRAVVTAVHVHEQATGRLLFTVPLMPAAGPPFVITRVFTRQPYAGAADWNELYTLLGEEAAYLDVHTGSNPEPALRGALRRDNAGWRTFAHAYCS